MSKISIYVVISLLVISSLLLVLSINDSYYDNYSPPKENLNYIKPTEFKITNSYDPECQSSNLCDSTVLKPIIPVNVDYDSKMPSTCPCTKYLEPP